MGIRGLPPGKGKAKVRDGRLEIALGASGAEGGPPAAGGEGGPELGAL